VERRATGIGDSLRSYRVVLDDTEIGRLGVGGTFAFATQPGRHTLNLAIDWARSRSIAFDIAAGQEKRFQCWRAAKLPGASRWSEVYKLTVGARRWISLEVIETEKPPD
jgi:hypothetical protein